MSSASVLEARGLTKHFGDRVALDGVDLSLVPGEVFGYLGPNGAGKTTTMRLLLGALRPTSGSSSLMGTPSADPRSRELVGHLPGDLHLEPAYTTRDLLDLDARIRGRHDEARVTELLERFELDPTRPVGELSTGNRRKVGLVLAFAHRPRLALLDEPTSGLDPLLQQQFVSLIREEVEAGTTVLLSSHVLPEVQHLADRVGIIRDGRLVTVSTVDALRERARRRVELTLDQTPELLPVGELLAVPGVRDATVLPGPGPGTTVVHVVVEGSIDALVKLIARHTVTSITTHDDDLDDVFLSYFSDDTDTTEGGS